MTAPAAGQTGGVTAEQLAVLAALVEAQAAVRGQLTAAAAAAATGPFAALTAGDWWDSGKVGAAVADVLKVLQPLQRQAARTTDAYLARAATALGVKTSPAGAVDITRLRRAIPDRVVEELVDGTRTPAFVVIGDTFDGPNEHIDAPVRFAVPDPNPPAATAKTPAGTASVGDTAVGDTAVLERVRQRQAERAAAQAARSKPAASGGERGEAADPADVYGRVADQYRFQVVAKGTPNERARQYALVRLETLAETDVTLAVREQVRTTTGKIKGVTGYRRVVRPDRTETGPCGLCVVAADRIYSIAELEAIHRRCACETLPIIGDLDPGLFLNASDREALYAAAAAAVGREGEQVTGGGKRHGGALKKIRVALAEHGELGPVLVDADQEFRGPVKVAKTKHPDPKVRARAELAALEKTFEQLRRRQAAGEDVDQPLKWQANRIDELRRIAAG